MENIENFEIFLHNVRRKTGKAVFSRDITGLQGCFWENIKNLLTSKVVNDIMQIQGMTNKLVIMTMK